MVLWFTKKSKTNKLPLPRLCSPTTCGHNWFARFAVRMWLCCGWSWWRACSSPALCLLPPGPATFHIQRHPVWRYWWDIAPSFSTLIPLPYFPPVVLVPLLFPLPGCGFPSGSGRLVDQAVGLLGCLPSLWPAWRLHAGNVCTRDCCLPRCKCTVHRAGSVHSVSNPVLCLWLGLLADNWEKWDESRVILPLTHPPCWKFSDVVG